MLVSMKWLPLLQSKNPNGNCIKTYEFEQVESDRNELKRTRDFVGTYNSIQMAVVAA